MVNIGDKYRCIKNVVMDDSGDIAFTAGKVYECEVEYSLTDNQGDKEHVVDGYFPEANGLSTDWLAEHFVKAKSEVLGEIEEGDKFLCIKTVTMDQSDKVAFTEGKEYTSEYDGKLTNNQGNKSHSISPSFLVEHFKRLESQEFFYIPDQPTTVPISETGYKESDNKLAYEIDFEFITQMAERMAQNKGKYEPYNWQKPHDVASLKQALFRHTLELMNGNHSDDGRDYGHLESIALNVMMINYQLKKYGK
jgi:hypothetical protein